jgi:hypothetical protein
MTGKHWKYPPGSLRFPISKSVLLLIFILMLSAATLIEYFFLGLARRTFVFYAIDSGVVSVEDRMLKISGRSFMWSLSREVDIVRYVEEALLGPVSPGSMPLFPKGTGLRSLMYRNGVVYMDLSEDALLPPLEGGEVLVNLVTLCSGIQRNFSFVRDVRPFINGRTVYAVDFRQSGEFRQSGGAAFLEGLW